MVKTAQYLLLLLRSHTQLALCLDSHGAQPLDSQPFLPLVVQLCASLQAAEAVAVRHVLQHRRWGRGAA